MPALDINEEIIYKRYESLPDDLKSALMGVSASDAIYETGRKHNLHIEKIGALAEEVGLIILGFVPAANFISDLKRALEINEEKASEIAGDINERVFLPIRESLKRIHGAAWADGLTKPPVRVETPRFGVNRPVTPATESAPVRVPPSHQRPLVREETKLSEASPKPKKPLIIRPMGAIPELPVLESRSMAEKTSSAEVKAQPTPPIPPVPGRPAMSQKPMPPTPPAILPSPRPLTTPPQPPSQLPTEKVVADRKPATPQLPPRPATIATPAASPVSQRPADLKPPEKIGVPPPPPRPAGTDPYREPVE